MATRKKKVADTPPDAEMDAGLVISKASNVPMMRIRVNPGNNVVHDEIGYHENDEVTLDGPTAYSLAMNGHATIVGVES